MTEQSSITDSETIVELTNHNMALQQRVKFLEEKVAMLEQRLEQRFEATKSEYKPENFDSLRGLVISMFTELEPTTALTMREIVEAFRHRYPNVNSANVPRRVFELCSKEFGEKLGKKQTEEKEGVQYFLRLKGDAEAEGMQLRQDLNPFTDSSKEA